MARKKLTKKASQATLKVKYQTKKTALTVAQTLKQLPKQIKTELAALKKKASQLAAALKKAKKQQKKIAMATNKKSTPKQQAKAKKASTLMNRAMAIIDTEYEKINKSMAFLMDKQAIMTALNKPMAKKQPLKATAPKQVKSTKKAPKKLKALTPKTSIRDMLKTESIDVATPKTEDTFN